ncbi:MAG: FAD-dependent oxidoreductase, partial [Candidatus Cloacimonetes bacterium]|nr:FAD-dependent oxidoreductase [Candidatus Cloacimonadota bacterium]
LIAGYHALQAGIEVVGLAEAMPKCGGYKVHSDKLRRLGVPIFTSHTIISANGDESVSSVTIAPVDAKYKEILGSRKTFECDTILIAVGLDSLKEFSIAAEIAGIKTFAAGDALEIAEASSAMFNGKITGVKISKEFKPHIDEIPQKWYEKAEVLKSHPGKTRFYQENVEETGVFPVIHCLEEIPCNPCITSCPTNSIKMEANSIMNQPMYNGSCIGCAKCLNICPGLAISIVDFRKDQQNPTVSLPYEISNIPVNIGDEVEVMDIDANKLGMFKVISIIQNKEFKTQQIKLIMPRSIAKKAISFKIQNTQQLPPIVNPQSPISEMVCLCERVKDSEIRELIKKGIRDINQIKGMTRLGMGACGSKTCDSLIRQIFREEGIKPEEIIAHTNRPLFVEVPIEKFVCSSFIQQNAENIPDESPNINSTVTPISNSQFSTTQYNVIVIGAGSVGVPTTMALAQNQKKTLCLESLHSPGQGNNKKAIGGVRATHSDFGKINICQRSIDIFSSWKKLYGKDIGWMSNGYSYPAYDEETERKLLGLMKIQKEFGLNISWISPDEYANLVPGISMEGLRGSTYSPDDGSCSPLLACNEFYFKSLEYGAQYRFSENVVKIKYENNLFTIYTDKGKYNCEYLVNASGNYANDISKMLNIKTNVTPDCHEAAITDQVNRFFGPMVVDLRLEKGSQNYYFYQNFEGQVVFCITPDPIILGTDNYSTSQFLPQCSSRMVKLYPRLKNLKIRRSWRGQYPMTPDGFPIIGRTKEFPNFIQAIGMCGQGFMLGPGVGELIDRIISDSLSADDKKILISFDPYRTFSGSEAFK